MSQNDAQMDQKYLDMQSRTIGTYGLETMTKLIAFKVLIVGCGGVGIETAKNLALAGIHTIGLYDPRPATTRDMGVNFAITEEVVRAGKTIAEASSSYIAELNPNTRVRVVTELSETTVAPCTALIVTSDAVDLSLQTLCRWNHFCHAHRPVISFLFVYQGGALGSVFADHGDNFTVKDLDGRPMLQKSVTEVLTRKDKAGDAYSRIRYETPEGETPGALRDYTQIKFSEVQGLTKANGESVNGVVFDAVVCPGDPRDTVRIYPSLEQQGYSPYQTGGFLHELKEVRSMRFRTLHEALPMPGTFTPVSPMMDNSEESQAHIALHALLRFADSHGGRLPALHDVNQSEEVIEMARTVVKENKSLPQPPEDTHPPKAVKEEFPFKLPPPPPPAPLVVDIQEDTLRRTALLSRATLQPLAAFFGGVVAQEVVKITGRYTPVHQWFHFSAEAVLPDGADYTSEEYAPQNSRYDNQIAIFGKGFQRKLENLRVFMVGCGALGCENVKNFALTGISCGPGGSFVVTDNDRIEISNLSRQFLFREDNVGQSKSSAAAERMRQINPDAKMDARQDFVGPNTEHLFPDTFWSGLDVVVNALDNMEARLYVDQQCVRFHKILVEAGTMGTGGNVDIIVPGKTSSYADGGAADQTGGIPMCTLRNFPYMYDHCIEWARAQFDDLFVAPMQSAHQIIEDPTAFVQKISHEVESAKSAGEKRSLIEKNLSPLRGLHRTLEIIAGGADMSQCARLGWDQMFSLFRDRIFDLQRAFPKDAKKKNGDPFWSGNRKYPAALEVDPNALAANEDVVNFLISTINLYACMFGAHPPKPAARFNDEKHRWMQQYRTVEWLESAVKDFGIPPYHASSVDDLDDDLKNAASEVNQRPVAEEEQEMQELLSSVQKLASQCQGTAAAPLEFEKDDDDNFQIDFIAATSNIRATNYVIPTADRMKVKLVAGKIIPAIATTTSAVTGLSLIELFKVLQNKDVACLRNGMLDVGTDNFVLFERDPPVVNRTKVVSTYLPEQDYTYRKKIICVPDGFTKYDAITIPVNPSTTVQQFADALVEKLNATLPPGADYSYEVDGIGVGKGMIWNGLPKHTNTNVSIMHAIEQQRTAEAGGSLPSPFWENRLQFCDLSVTISVDDGDTNVDEEDVETANICLKIEK